MNDPYFVNLVIVTDDPLSVADKPPHVYVSYNNTTRKVYR